MVMAHLAKIFDDEIHNAAPEEAERIVISKYTALGMFAHFPFKDTTQFEELKSEMEFRIKLMRGVYFKGRIDGLVKKNGQWWLRELKTTSQTQRQFQQRIATASQGSAYVWAMKELGYDVQGIMYDFIKKPLLRKRVNENQHDFGSRILTDYKKRPDFYFTQIYSYRSDQEIKLWKLDAESLARDMIGKRRSKRYYRNTMGCYNYNFECEYKKICFEEVPDKLMLQLYYRQNGKAIS